MKPLAALLLALLALAPAIRAGSAIDPVLISVKGTAVSQLLTGTNTGKAIVTKITNDFLFDEFGVSKSQYALVADFGPAFAILFRQKNSSGNLPDIIVADFGSTVGAADTTEKLFTVGFEGTSPATNNLFEGLQGHFGGTFTYKGALPAIDIKKATFSFIGQCRNIDPDNTSPSLLRFKFRATGDF